MYLIMSIMILGLHCVDMSVFQTNNTVLAVNQVLKIFYNMGVPTFFFISAILFYRKIETKKYIKVLRSKTITILIPYLCWNIIYWILKEVESILINQAFIDETLLQKIIDVIMSTWNPVLWFIRVLIIYIICYPIILWVIKRKTFFYIVLIVIFSYNIYIGPAVGYATASFWLPVYLLGAFIVYWSEELVLPKEFKRSKNSKLIIFFIIQIILIGFAYYSDLGLYICRMLSPVCFWVLADILAINRDPRWWMKQSFFYFCSQLIFANFIEIIYITIFGNGAFSAVLSNFINPILLLITLIVCGFSLNKISKPIYKLLTGGR